MVRSTGGLMLAPLQGGFTYAESNPRHCNADTSEDIVD